MDNVRLDNVASNSLSLTLTYCSSSCSGPAINIAVHDSLLQKDLKNFKKGDHLSIAVLTGSNESVLQACLGQGAYLTKKAAEEARTS